jgi:pimeloyl-ACP methyl ester carboxylesterase
MREVLLSRGFPAVTEPDPAPLPAAALPRGVRSRFVSDVNGLRMHILEAGFEDSHRPCVLLLHGFPELAYSWRKVMLPLAEAGFHVVAPDQRGYGGTTGGDGSYDCDLRQFFPLNLVRDTLALVLRLSRDYVAAVIGHDFGSPVAAWCALARPDVFRSVVLMSAPFSGPPGFPVPPDHPMRKYWDPERDLHRGLAALDPPRKHYQRYYTTREADADMRFCKQGIHDFLRAYYHVKSTDWRANRPYPLTDGSAEAFAKLPTYYVMEADKTMAETVATEMPSPQEIAACKWLTDDELRIYSGAFARTGFQGGLNWYRARVEPACEAELTLFAGSTIGVKSCFIAGKSDWGVYQRPGDFIMMQAAGCRRMLGCHLVEGAGHWVQQEQAPEVSRLLVRFLRQV